ncbi:MAG: cell division protein FtsZ [Bacteroidales bacterium]|nr:cell division protein FtsZ [Bacteroidales bacterium]
MTDRIDITADYGARENSSIIKVIGVGGGGSNAVKHMYSEGIVGVDFLVCNTDQGHLSKSPVPEKLLLGTGLGAGAKPEIARQYALDSKEKIMDFIGRETKMLFITAGMGKGTGTGASPVIAEIAHEMGILTIGVVTAPFKFEGSARIKQAERGIAELDKYVDSLIVVKNQNILKFYQEDTLSKAYSYADDVLKNAVKCIAELITVNYEQNVDFHDIETIMKDSGKAMLGLAVASGADRVERVVDDALRCPLLDNPVIADAQNFLFFISYGPDNELKVSELEALTEKFEAVKSPEAEVIWGRGVDESLGDALKLSVIVTNFNSQAREILEKELTTVVTDDKRQDDIFKTDIQMGTKVEENNTPVAPKADDYETLTTPREEANVQQTPNVSIFDYKEPAVAMEPQVQPAPQAFFTPGSGPQRIEEPVDPLFHDEEDFQYKIETPAILRQTQERMSTLQTTATPATSTMEYTPMYEVANDLSEFFSDLAD